MIELLLGSEQAPIPQYLTSVKKCYQAKHDLIVYLIESVTTVRLYVVKEV